VRKGNLCLLPYHPTPHDYPNVMLVAKRFLTAPNPTSHRRYPFEIDKELTSAARTEDPRLSAWIVKLC
jgi:hypothetical protein